MKRGLATTGLLVLGILLTVSCGMTGGNSDPIDQLIQETRPEPAERKFRTGMKHYNEGSFNRAHEAFKTVVDDYPDHPRVSDAEYYLERVKPHVERSGEVPMIRVKLGEEPRLTATQDRPLKLSFPDRSTRNLNPEEDIQIQSSNGKLRVVLDGESLVTEGPVTLQSEEGGTIRLDDSEYRGVLQVHRRQEGLVLVNELPMNEYLYGVVRKETAPDWPLEALKTQAVASRTFALYRMLEDRSPLYHLDATWFSQVYGGREAETDRVIQAVNETVGNILTHKNQPIPAYFHANSGGHTEAPKNVWSGSSSGALQAVKDPQSVGQHHDRWEKELSWSVIREALQSGGHPRPAAHPELIVEKRTPAGRALTVSYPTVNGNWAEISANELRMVVGPGKIRSTWLVTIRPDGQTVYFEGKGWGHGVGLSQWGAYAMAKEGKDYRAILQHYYPSARFRESLPEGLFSDA